MSTDVKPQTWRCLIGGCPTRGEWQVARGETAEDAWEHHLRAQHNGVSA